MDAIVFQVIINGLLIGGFYALIGIGLNVIFGVMRVTNFSQGEFLMIGMYVTYVLNTVFSYGSVPDAAVFRGPELYPGRLVPEVFHQSFIDDEGRRKIRYSSPSRS